MHDRQADLFADFGFAGADRFNILLIKHDVVGSRWVDQRCSSWLWALRGTLPGPAVSVAPTAVVAGSAAYPPPEQQRYGCDFEILEGASQASPRLP